MFKTFIRSGKSVIQLLKNEMPYTTRPLSRCYLRLYLIKNTAGAHKEPSKKYKTNLRTLKSKSYEQCRTKHESYNNKAPHVFQLDYRFSRSDKSFGHIQNHTNFTSSLRCNYLLGYVLRPKREFSDLNWFKSDSSVILLL